MKFIEVPTTLRVFVDDSVSDEELQEIAKDIRDTDVIPLAEEALLNDITDIQKISSKERAKLIKSVDLWSSLSDAPGVIRQV